jgi:hypothetical protein
LGGDSQATEKVEGNEALGQHLVPQVEREISVGGSNTGDEVILERVHGTSSGVASVYSRGG